MFRAKTLAKNFVEVVQEKEDVKDRNKNLARQLKTAQSKLQKFQAKDDSVLELRRQVNDLSAKLELNAVRSQQHINDVESLNQQEVADLRAQLQRDRDRSGWCVREPVIIPQPDMPAHSNRSNELENVNAQLHGQLTEQKELHARALENASTGKSAVGLASVIGVSPNKMAKVTKASKRGSLKTELMENATTANGNKPAFLKRVEATLTPLLEHICHIPKFKSGQADSGGVAAMLLGKIARKKSSKAKRRLNYGRPKQVTAELDVVLKELAGAWRTAFRDHDRDLSARLLQLALKTIPSRHSTVTNWLGPR